MTKLVGLDITVTTPDGKVLAWQEFSDATEADIREQYEGRGNTVTVKPVTLEFTAKRTADGGAVISFGEVE